MNKREQFLLREALDFLIYRYLLSNHRRQGFEKAEIHIDMSKIIFQYIYIQKYRSIDFDKMMKIHDGLTEITDNLDRYGFDINDSDQDLSPIAEKTLDAIMKWTDKYLRKKMNRCDNDECIVGYEGNPEGASFLSIEDYLSYEANHTESSDLWGYDVFKYCPECGCKVKEILRDFKQDKKP